VLCSLLWVTLLGQGVGLGDPHTALPTPTMLGSCEPPPFGWGHRRSAPSRGRSHRKARGSHLTVLVGDAELNQQVLPSPAVVPGSRGAAPASPPRRVLSQHGQARSDLIPAEGSCANGERWEVTRRPRAGLSWAARS